MRTRSNYFSKQGFTLVELLVVISIIGLLSSFAVVSLNTARAKARDALRKGDMAQIRTALNLYYDDNEGYPVATANADCDNWPPPVPPPAPPYGAEFDQDAADCFSAAANSLSTALTGGARPYLGTMPKDPRNPTNVLALNEFVYRYVSDGVNYAIAYRLEDEPGVDQFVMGW
jgi:prepilin-type N-terminal cleavage/methylation domain-containing protein